MRFRQRDCPPCITFTRIPEDRRTKLSLAICNRNCVWFFAVGAKPKSKPRSGCPVSVSLEILGDRWSLLIIRDLMVRGYSTFREFQDSGERIATNILSDRL